MPFTLPEKFTIILEMKSDWHVGSGTGIPRNIDRLLMRDYEELPFVPAKSLTGIWRDAVERLALGLDNNDESGYWSQLVDTIFGNQPALTKAKDTEKQKQKPNKAILRISPARLPVSLRKVLKGSDKKALCDALTFIKPGVRIDEKSGTSVTDMLRFEEMGRVGTILQAECQIDWENLIEQEKKDAFALLFGGTRLVERIGGKRRRGAGKCELKVKENSEDFISASIKHLKKEEHPFSADFFQQPKEAKTIEKKTVSTGADWIIIPFLLRLETPVSIVRNTLGNVAESLDFVPGTYLLPFFSNNFDSAIFRQAIAQGNAQVLPATIEIDNSKGLPVPRSFSQDKIDGGFTNKGTVRNRFCDEIGDDDQQQKPFRSGYIGIYGKSLENGKGKLPKYKNTPMTILTHNTVKDDIQRPNEEVGGVYSREAIKGGTILRSELRLRKEVFEALQIADFTLLDGNCKVGTSDKDDYGLVRVEILGKDEKSIEKHEIPSLKEKDGKKLLTVCLLSDVLLRSDNLRLTEVDELRKFLAKKLEVKLKNYELTEKEKEKRLISSLISIRRIESWHESWGFPRPSFIALEAGSCAIFEVSGNLDFDKLKELELVGIGERRGEGYGQIAFNSPILTEKILGWEAAEEDKNQNNSTGEVLEENEDAFEYARQIEKTAWRKIIERKVLLLADNKGFVKNTLHWTEKPNQTQAGSLRSALQRLNEPNDKDVIGWLDHLEKTSNRKDKWNEEARKMLRNILNDERKIWELLKEEKVFKFPPGITKDSEKQMKKELWTEAVRALFDAVSRSRKRETENQTDG